MKFWIDQFRKLIVSPGTGIKGVCMYIEYAFSKVQYGPHGGENCFL